MLTPKIILYRHKTYSDGTHPIIIQVVKNGKPIRKVIGRCFAKDWLSSKSRVSPRALEAPRLNNNIDVALRDYGLNKEYTLQALFQERIDKFKINNQVSRYDANRVVLEQLIEFSPKVDFNDVDERFIYRFAAFLSGPPHSNNPNTLNVKMGIFGSVMKLARKKKLISDNPFEDVSFPKQKTTKSKLSIEEIQLFINAELTGKQDMARDIFLSSIYMRGARVGDVINLLTKNVSDGRLEYTELKTGKHHSIALTPELKNIFDKWIGKSKLGYIFPLMDVPQKAGPFVFKASIKKTVAEVNRYLKQVTKMLGIEKKVSTHTARHSFSRLANSTIKDTTITKDLVGHATLAVHEGYISDLADDVIMDAYAKQVLDRLKKD